MARNRFVKARTVKLDLSDGDWIEIKSKLSYGEQSKLTGTMTPSLSPDTKGKATSVDIDWAEYSLQRISAYVVDWSFVDGSEQRIKPTRDNIFALDQESAAEIEAAIDAYLTNEQEKKVLTTDTMTNSEPS